MESRFKRGDVIKEKNFENTMKYVVLDTCDPKYTFAFSYNGFSASIRREYEGLYEKIGSIDLKPLMEEIKKGGVI